MEEEKLQKRTKRLYVVMGVLLLIIALVSGTYAYFSASVSNTNTIGGNTQNINNNSLTLTVKKVVFNGTSAPSNDLVPAWLGYSSGTTLNVANPSALGQTQVSNMLSHKCEQDGFTGCHVYQIKISADQNVTHANLLLNLSLSNLSGASSIEDKSQWGYVVFKADGTVDSSTGTTAGLSNPVLNADNGAPAAIGDDVTNLDIHNDSSLSTTEVIYYLLVYLNDTGESQNTANSGDNNYAVGSYSGTLELQALGGKVRACFSPSGNCEVQQPGVQTAAQYITSLYTNANKTPVTVNEITYNLAPIFDNDEDNGTSGGLMDDRLASSSTPANTVGNIRYYGANPNNYVWLGDTYTENNQEIKKLWRVIGVSNGRLKIIQKDFIGDYVWDASEAGVNNGSGINQWGPSGNYEGADLMRLLNNESGAYWIKNGDFVNTGLSDDEKSLIDTVTWYLGAYGGPSFYADVQYNSERQNDFLGKLCNNGDYCTDEVTRTPTWSGKVGLIYPSDYGYAADFSQCASMLFKYNDNFNCYGTNWLYSVDRSQWTISPYFAAGNATYVFTVWGSGDIGCNNARYNGGVRPVVYLNSDVTISEGDGSYDHPYVLSLS